MREKRWCMSFRCLSESFSGGRIAWFVGVCLALVLLVGGCGGGGGGTPRVSAPPPATVPEVLDTDGDRTGNNADPDDDNDGVADAADAFPLDPDEWVDTDGDGIGNNAYPDDDNDGVPDEDDPSPLDPWDPPPESLPIQSGYKTAEMRELLKRLPGFTDLVATLRGHVHSRRSDGGTDTNRHIELGLPEMGTEITDATGITDKLSNPITLSFDKGDPYSGKSAGWLVDGVFFYADWVDGVFFASASDYDDDLEYELSGFTFGIPTNANPDPVDEETTATWNGTALARSLDDGVGYHLSGDARITYDFYDDTVDVLLHNLYYYYSAFNSDPDPVLNKSWNGLSVENGKFGDCSSDTSNCVEGQFYEDHEGVAGRTVAGVWSSDLDSPRWYSSEAFVGAFGASREESSEENSPESPGPWMNGPASGPAGSAAPSAEASWSGTALAPLGGTARYSGDAAGRIARHGKDGGAFTADAELVADFGLGVGLPRRRRRIARGAFEVDDGAVRLSGGLEAGRQSSGD